MSIEENKALIRRIAEEVFTQLNPDAVDELYAADFVNHSPAAGQAPDRAGIKQSIARLRDSGADMREILEDLIAEGDKVVERYTMRGTHTTEIRGPAGPIPPTGKTVSWTGTATFRVVNGKVAERWANADTLGLLQQLGAIPTAVQSVR